MKIRQELNILCGVTGGTNARLAPSGRVYLTAENYDGASFYVEVVGSATSGTTGSIRFREEGVDKFTFPTNNLPTGTGLFRTGTFTPSTGGKLYTVAVDSGGSGKTVNLRSARIVVLQSSGTLVKTESQIEIGNVETQQSISNTPLSQPKYWQFDTGSFDNTSYYDTELIHKRDSNMSDTTWRLYAANNAFVFGSSGDTIIANSTAATVTRTRIPFFPIANGYYRLMSIDSDTMNGSHTTYNCKIINTRPSFAQSYPPTLLSAGSALFGDSSTGNNEMVGQSFTIGNSDVTAFKVRFACSNVGPSSDSIILEVVSGSISGSTVLSSGITASTPSGPIELSINTSLSANTKYYLRYKRNGNRSESNWCSILSAPTWLTYPSASGENWQRHNGAWVSSTNSSLGFIIIGTASSPLTLSKLKTEYLLVNVGGSGSSTGLKKYHANWDPNEWDADAGTITYTHQSNGDSSASLSLKLQSNPDSSPVDITNSTISNSPEVRETTALTMPSASKIDVNVTSTGVLNASRIIVTYSFVASGLSSVITRRRIFFCT
jgi:hypothetical protein